MTSVPSIISELVERFDRNRESYLSAAYNETQLRREFLDPFFGKAALGWDVDNEAGSGERYKDVVHEDSIRIAENEALKAPDYCFRYGGTRKFFVEAKRPLTDILNEKEPAFQLRRYAFSAKLPLSILTNFKEFVVYDCRFKPVKTDKPQTACILHVSYTQYCDQWGKIAGVFSPDAIRLGAFDKYAESTTGKKGTTEVDEAILKDIEGWREELAHNIALRNSDLTVDELNTAVSRTIDRILFLRVCEDRGTEPDDQLKNCLKSRGMYARLFDLFHRADQRYNSGLFHFSREPGREEAPDKLTPKLKVDDTPLKGIIRSLYYPDCPYVWKVIPADILGQVYEQFLGKIIRLTKGHQAKVEDKPEVKKAGGVYYTPTYIVDYIVEHTVGKLLEGKSPKEAAKLRILDPACGSGSFLIGAYQHLLDWYLEQYVNSFPPTSVGGQEGGSGLSQADKKRAAELPIYQAARGEWRLSLAERKRILLDHIYGVDIDAQAVEVTKLSLLLKVLEGETHDTLESELKLRIRALPDLAANIKCGNSLIGTDFYSDHPDLSEDERRRINPFDWKEEFKEVFKQGGFDAVIGNPPYINMMELDKVLHPGIKPYWKSKYQSAAGAFDIYVLFIEQAAVLSRTDGLISFIVPNKFLAAEYAVAFRRWLLENARFLSLADYSRVKVWKASVYPVVPVFQKATPDVSAYVTVEIAATISSDGLRPAASVACSRLGLVPDNIWSFITRPGADILLKVLALSEPLERFAEVSGSCTVGEGSEYPPLVFDSPRSTHGRNSAKFVVSGSVTRYATTWGHAPVHFTHKTYDKPLIKLRTPMPARRIEQARAPKIIVCKVALEPRAYPDLEGEFAGAYTTYIQSHLLDLRHLTAILNSRLMAFLFRGLYDALAMAGGYLRFQPPQMKRLPIRTINFSDKKDNARHDKMVSLVEKMLELNKDLQKARTDTEQTRLKRQIAATDKQIDQLVYELYGLTEEEIRIVEGSEKKT